MIFANKMGPAIGQGRPKRVLPTRNKERDSERSSNGHGSSPNGNAESSGRAESLDIHSSLPENVLDEDLSRPTEDDFPSSSAQLDDFDARLFETAALVSGSADLEGLHSMTSLTSSPCSSASRLRMGRFTRPVNTVRSSIQRQAGLHADMVGVGGGAAQEPIAAPLLPRAKVTPALPIHSSRVDSSRRVIPVRRLGERQSTLVNFVTQTSKNAKEVVSEEEMERRVEAQVDISSVRALPNQEDSNSDNDS